MSWHAVDEQGSRGPDNMNCVSTILLFGGKINFFKLFICRGLRFFAVFFLVEFRMKCAGLCKGAGDLNIDSPSARPYYDPGLLIRGFLGAVRVI